MAWTIMRCIYSAPSNAFRNMQNWIGRCFSVAAGSIAGKPPGLSHTEAAALPLAGVSALQAVKEVLSLSPGQKVLIHGGAGGIGSIAIQLAKHLGARVATTVSSRSVDYVKKLGADEIIDSGSRDSNRR